MFQIQCLQSSNNSATEHFSKYLVGPFLKGQSVTVGNALRRVLLSNLQGVAIIGVRIIGIDHEFSTISNVNEDVVDILLNLKQIVLKGNVNEPTLARLAVNESGIITAENIELPNSLTLVDPRQYIATLNVKGSLEMEFLIARGQNYFTSGKLDYVIPERFLTVDAVFMPVTKVNFFVETSRNSSFSVTESLILEIATDGSLEPIEAISNAALILENVFASLKIKQSNPLQLPSLVEEAKPQNEYENVMLADLLLSVRAYNALKRANVHNLSELLKYSKEDLLEFKNFGQKSADEVCESLQKNFGIVLAKTKN